MSTQYNKLNISWNWILSDEDSDKTCFIIISWIIFEASIFPKVLSIESTYHVIHIIMNIIMVSCSKNWFYCIKIIFGNIIKFNIAFYLISAWVDE